MLPSVLLVDLDDTILRFTAGQPDFWRLALEAHVPCGEHAALLVDIEATSTDFWSEPERAFWGRQNMHEARRRIALEAFARHGLSSDVARRTADTMTLSKEGHVRPFEGAIETLHALRQHGQRLGLLTNGSAEFQRKKLERFDLARYFDLILIEGELGYGKPDRRVFEAALHHFGVGAPQAWMVGDNLSADIAGAQQVGIFGVWHDAHLSGLPAASPARPDRIITRLSQLLEQIP